MRLRALHLVPVSVSMAVAAACSPEDRPAREAALLGRSSVLLVTLDTTRADRLGCYGDPGAMTPCLDALAAEGILFERALAPAPITLPSHAALLTGLYPRESGVHDNGIFRAGEELCTLAEVLGAAGYQTAAFVSSHVLARPTGLDQGFDVYDDRLEPQPDRHDLPVERGAPATVDAALAWLESAAPGPVFAWVHFYDPHFPYAPPPRFARGARSLYDGEIRLVDHELARLLEGWRAAGRLDDTLVVVTADHGEALGQHREVTHGFLLHDATMRVPLLLRHPALAPRRIGGQVVLVDLYPTILDAVGLAVPPDLPGRSLLPVLAGSAELPWHDAFLETRLPLHSFAVAPQEALSTREYKYVESPKPELYAWPGDPREEHNQFAALPEVARTLAARLGALRASLAPRGAAETVALSAEEAARFEALGYVQGPGDGAASGFSGMDVKDALVLFEKRDRARQHLQLGQLEEARYLLNELLQQCPRDSESLASLGEVSLRLDQPDAALDAFERALAVRPDLVAVSLAVARLYRERGDTDRALRHYESVLHRNPGAAEPALAAAALEHERGNTPRAVELLDAALRLAPLTPEQRAAAERDREAWRGE